MSQPKARTRLTWKRLIGYVISIAIVVAIFAWAIPKYADYHDVLSAIRTLTPLESWSLVAATIFNLVTYWWANQAALPGMGIGKAAVLTQTTTSVANTLPAGGAIAIGLTYSILDIVGVHRHERRAVRGRDRHLEHLHEARAADACAGVPRAQRAPDPRVHRRGYRRSRGTRRRGGAVRAPFPQRDVRDPDRQRARSVRVLVPSTPPQATGHGMGRGCGPVPTRHDRARPVPMDPVDLVHGAEPIGPLLRPAPLASSHGHLRA